MLSLPRQIHGRWSSIRMHLAKCKILQLSTCFKHSYLLLYIQHEWHSIRTSSVSAMLHRLEWNIIEYQVKVLSLVLFYKIIHGQVDLALPNYIQTNPRLTRGNDLKFIQPSTNTNVYKHSFFPATVRAWNSLPANITHADSTDVFKSYLTLYCATHN